jgi:hypothetical protein
MPRNGTNGNYSLPVPPFTPNTVISSSDVNSDFSDIATALTASLCSDGQTALTGQLKGAVGTTPPFTATGVTTSGFGIAAGPIAYMMVANVQIVAASAAGAAVTGTLTSSGALTVSAGGANVSGASSFSGTLTVSSGGVAVTGNSTVTGTLTVSNTLTASSGFTVSAGPVAFPAGSIARAAMAAGFPTVQRFTTGAANYTPSAGVTYIRVRMCGGGGGGGSATGAAGTAGNNSSFGSWTAIGGSAGPGNVTTGSGGAGGTGGVDGTGTQVVRLPGGRGLAMTQCGASAQDAGGAGGANPFGGAGAPAGNAAGNNGATNTGAGGAGGGSNNSNMGYGGGAGEYVEFFVNAPGTIAYSVGAAANGGAAGTNAGGNGAAGIIIVEEYYT